MVLGSYEKIVLVCYFLYVKCLKLLPFPMHECFVLAEFVYSDIFFRFIVFWNVDFFSDPLISVASLLFTANSRYPILWIFLINLK
jgi:hypothetical protein